MKKLLIFIITVSVVLFSACGRNITGLVDDLENSYYMADIDKEIEEATMAF